MGKVIWDMPKHNFKEYRSLGLQKIYQFGTFYMMMKIGISGVAIKEENNMILLENSYVIKRKTLKETNNHYEEFMNFSRKYAEATEENVQRELLESRVTEKFIKEDQMMSNMAAMICQTESEVQNIRTTLLDMFPETAGQLIFMGENRVFVRRRRRNRIRKVPGRRTRKLRGKMEQNSQK